MLTSFVGLCVICFCSRVAEAKKEEKKAESESEDDDMGFGLFD